MLTLADLATASEDQMANFDIAEVDLACAVGLRGSEGLDIPACLAWLDRAAAWVRQHTEKNHRRFRNNRGVYHDSEAIFRVVAMYEVIQRGLKIRYAAHRRWDTTGPWPDSRDNFIHGPISGYGGTCASLPVLIIAVGRRLGYPLKLVATQSHYFARWDAPDGERFNIDGHEFDESSGGPNIHPDHHYLTWPHDIRNKGWEATHYLRSMTPREEVASALLKRGFCFKEGGDQPNAVRAFAQAVSICYDNALMKNLLIVELMQWEKRVQQKLKTFRALNPWADVSISLPKDRRYPGLPGETEAKIVSLEAWERLLNQRPIHRRLLTQKDLATLKSISVTT